MARLSLGGGFASVMPIPSLQMTPYRQLVTVSTSLGIAELAMGLTFLHHTDRQLATVSTLLGIAELANGAQ